MHTEGFYVENITQANMHTEGFYVENITLTLTANVPNNKVHNTLA